MSRKRQSLPESLVQQVLLNSKRRCCICHEHGNDNVREGDIAHIMNMSNRPSAANEENLVFLCHTHHKEFDSGKLSVGEVRRLRAKLYRSLAKPSQPTKAEGANPFLRYERQVYELIATEFARVFPSTATIHLNRPYPGRSGSLRELDVSANLTVAGLHILIAVEVKYATRIVGVEAVESFAGLLRDVGAAKGLLVTNTNFSEAARQTAESFGIALATLTEVEKGWNAATVFDVVMPADSP
jgi:hypothetical protein